MGKTLQHFELHVLLAMLLERGETYSVPLVVALERRTGRRVAQAAVFIALSRLEKKILFGVSPTDPRTMAGVPLALLAAAALACLVPGLRAARVDPAEILRET